MTIQYTYWAGMHLLMIVAIMYISCYIGRSLLYTYIVDFFQYRIYIGSPVQYASIKAIIVCMYNIDIMAT